MGFSLVMDRDLIQVSFGILMSVMNVLSLKCLGCDLEDMYVPFNGLWKMLTSLNYGIRSVSMFLGLSLRLCKHG